MQRAMVYTDGRSWGGKDLLSCVARLAWNSEFIDSYLALRIVWQLRRGSIAEHPAAEKGAL